MFDDLWEKDRQAKLGREEREEDARKEMDRDHKLILDQQVQELHDYRMSERELAMQDSALMREQWEMERQEAARVDALRKEVQLTPHATRRALHGATHARRTLSGG